MVPRNTAKTSTEYWNSVYSREPSKRVPSKIFVATKNLQDELRKYISCGDRVLEIGCAPGKQLSYVARKYGARISGLDYSREGIRYSRNLLQALKITCDLRCEDVFNTTFEKESFDVVYSNGVIEHFEDPSKIVNCHCDLVRPGGKVLIFIPNYSGIYLRLQNYFDKENIDIHNLRIMSIQAMETLVQDREQFKVSARYSGSINPGLINIWKKWPYGLAMLTHYSLNLVGVLQPFKINKFCPMIVLQLEKLK